MGNGLSSEGRTLTFNNMVGKIHFTTMFRIEETSDYDGPCAGPPQSAITQSLATPLATLGLLFISVSIAMGLFGIGRQDKEKDLTLSTSAGN